MPRQHDRHRARMSSAAADNFAHLLFTVPRRHGRRYIFFRYFDGFYAPVLATMHAERLRYKHLYIQISSLVPRLKENKAAQPPPLL